MPKLIDVEADLVNMLDFIMEIEQSGEPVPPDAMALLEQYSMAAADKRDACAAFLEFVEDQEALCSARITEIAGRRTALMNARERMEKYILSIMESQGVIAAMGNTSKFVVKRSESVDPGDVAKIPAAYMRYKPAPAPEPDKKALKLALEAGPISGCDARIVTKSSLSVSRMAVKDRPGDTLLGPKP